MSRRIRAVGKSEGQGVGIGKKQTAWEPGMCKASQTLDRSLPPSSPRHTATQDQVPKGGTKCGQTLKFCAPPA
eukprot:365590-Chlamydomonas_euryale.AAC.6